MEFVRARNTQKPKNDEDDDEKFEQERFLSEASARVTSVPLCSHYSELRSKGAFVYTLGIDTIGSSKRASSRRRPTRRT